MEQGASISPSIDLFPFADRSPTADMPVMLTRVIKGLGFNHPASIVELDREYMVIQTAQIHLYACLEGQCYLQNPSFPAPVRARLVDRNLARRMVVLSGFSFLNCSWVCRCQDRVQPRARTTVAVQCGQKSLTASVVDLNAFGMSVFLRKPLAEEASLAIGDQIELSFRLQPKKPLEGIRGVVVHTRPVSGLLVRIGIRFLPDKTHHSFIEKYVALRRDEVLGELDQIFCRALEPRRVEDLYF